MTGIVWKELFREKIRNCETETLANFFFRNACEFPDKMALEWYDFDKDCVTGVTYEELFSDIVCLGTALYEKGFRGKTVSLVGERSYEWVLLFLTVLCSNMIVLPLDPNLDTGEIIKRNGFADTDACFTEEGLPHYKELTNDGSVKLYKLKDIMSMISDGRHAVENGDYDWLKDSIRESQRTVMIYTSGTGGKMKAAVIRQENFTLERYVWNGLAMQNSKCLITLPLYHIAGIGDLRGTLLVGTTAYLSSGLRYILKEYAYAKPKVGFMVPAQALLLYEVLSGKEKKKARELLGNNFSAIRATGAPLPSNIRDMFLKYDITVTSDYGMTETAGPVSVSMVKDGKIFSKEGSVGHILDCIDVRVDTPDENGCGEILISGQCVFDGYYKDKEETDSIIIDGWLHTGDIGYIDEDRFLYIVGRKKNVIILSSGENVIPEEIEKLIYRIPEVDECLVRGKNDRISVSLFCKDTVTREYICDEINKLNKTLPSYKRISDIDMLEEPLPKTSSGKIRRV